MYVIVKGFTLLGEEGGTTPTEPPPLTLSDSYLCDLATTDHHDDRQDDPTETRDHLCVGQSGTVLCRCPPASFYHLGAVRCTLHG